MLLLKAQHIEKRLPGGFIMSGINLQQQSGEKIAIAGASGAGKTTLLKMIAGLVQPDSGDIIFDGEKVAGPLDKLMPGHPKIAYLSQQYELLNNYRVEELVWFENTLTKAAGTAIFQTCGIGHLLGRRTDQLSGGEKQRIALCMLLMKSPKMLILDEPFSNLDLIHRTTLKKVLEDVTTRLEITCLLTSHDPQDVLPWADKIIVLKEGEIIQQGSPEQIYFEPLNEYVAALFGSYHLVSREQLRAFLDIEAGDQNTNSLIIRPEHFSIVTTGEKAVKGVVKKISFHGDHYKVKMEIGTISIFAYAKKVDFSVGDQVLVLYGPKNN